MQKFKQVRTIKPTRRSVSGQICFEGSYIPFESTLERDFLIFHTFRKDVIDLVAQPISIPFIKNGIEYEYTPDFFVQFYTGGDYECYETKPMIVEVKPLSEWKENWRDWSDKWKAAIQYCREQDFRFKIYDENRIRNKALININYINKFKNSFFDDSEKKCVIEQVQLMGGTTIGYLLERFFKGSLYRTNGRNLIFHLLANKHLEFDYWDELTELSEVWCE